ncbi:MAG: hypothetical protein AAF318_18235 [Pseudomonadota bacterium]
MFRLLTAAVLGGVVAITAQVAPSAAGDHGLYGHKGHRIVRHHHHAPRHGGPNEDSHVIIQDDRRTVACYDATYYPAKYRVDPQGIRKRGATYSVHKHGKRWTKQRHASVYLETRTRIKEDYVSLRKVHCHK